MLLDFDALFDRASAQADPERIRAALRALGLAPTELVPLSGGYRNFNFRLETPAGPAVLRLSEDARALAREAALLRRLGSQGLPVPELLGEAPGAALLAFCPGEAVNRLKPPPAELPRLGHAIGAALAVIHRQRFAEAGFFDADLAICEPLQPFGEAWLGYARGVLRREPARSRAGAALCERALDVLNRCAGLLDTLPAVNRLVHSDFNLKNLLAAPDPHYEHGWRITVLDWEFAHAGAPLADLGNFLRFEEALPVELGQGFLAGYTAAGGSLGAHWRDQARLLDIAALCGFLENPEPRPRSIATAIAQLGHSIEVLGTA